MQRLLTLVSTPIYQNSLSSMDAWRETIYNAFINDGWQVVSLNISFSVFSGGYLTLLVNVDNAYSDAVVIARANQILESIQSSFGQVFSNANFKILSDTVSPLTTPVDTTQRNQTQDTVISTTTVLLGVGLLALFLLKR